MKMIRNLSGILKQQGERNEAGIIVEETRLSLLSSRLSGALTDRLRWHRIGLSFGVKLLWGDWV
jgi:hypothetical protein